MICKYYVKSISLRHDPVTNDEYMSLVKRKPIFGFPTSLDANQHAQLRIRVGKVKVFMLSTNPIPKALIRLCGSAGCSVHLLCAYAKCRFCDNESHIIKL